MRQKIENLFLQACYGKKSALELIPPLFCFHLYWFIHSHTHSFICSFTKPFLRYIILSIHLLVWYCGHCKAESQISYIWTALSSTHSINKYTHIEQY